MPRFDKISDSTFPYVSQCLDYVGTEDDAWNFHCLKKEVPNKSWSVFRIIWSVTRRYLLVQSQQWKRQNNVWNLLKFANKDTRTTTLTSCVFLINFEQISHNVLVFPLLTLNKYINFWEKYWFQIFKGVCRNQCKVNQLTGFYIYN